MAVLAIHQLARLMGALHLVFWLVSTIFGLRFLKAAFSHSNAKSNAGLNTWMVIFVLVALQMTTALRPIVGTAETFLPPPEHKKFFPEPLGGVLEAGNQQPAQTRG